MPGTTARKQNRSRMVKAVVAVAGVSLVLAACGSTKDTGASSAGGGGGTGKVAQAVLAHGLRASRYRGLAKSSLQHQLTGAAIN
ncbi:hypothetical protein ACWDPP_34185, partial [Streptomyces sp. NPDC000851]